MMNRDQISEAMQKWGKDRFVLLFLAGLLLVFIAMPLDNQKEENRNETKEKTEISAEAAATELANNDVETYRKNLCSQLEDFLQHMEGVGRAKVYITMRSSGEKIVERNSPYTKRIDREQDGEKVKSTEETENASEVVLLSQGDGAQTPIVVKELTPMVQGVVVAIQGADNVSVKKDVIALVMALFAIEEHKIRVVKLNT